MCNAFLSVVKTESLSKGVETYNICSGVATSAEDIVCIIQKLRKLNIQINEYADDIILAIYNISNIKKTIKVLEEWAEYADMKFNKEKTKILLHTKMVTFKNETKILGMEKVTHTKALGAILDSNLNNA